jgi:hypothetical protein
VRSPAGYSGLGAGQRLMRFGPRCPGRCRRSCTASAGVLMAHSSGGTGSVRSLERSRRRRLTVAGSPELKLS